MAELSVKVPIKFSEKAQRDLYETCMGYKKLAEMRGAENEKLRELVRKYGEYTSQDRCEGCACKSRCNDGDVDECWQLTEIRELARELGVGVGE